MLKEPSHWNGSFEYPQHMFWLRNKKILFSYTLISGGLTQDRMLFDNILFAFFVLCFFSKKCLEYLPSVSSSLDPDQAQDVVGPDLDPICLQRLSASIKCFYYVVCKKFKLPGSPMGFGVEWAAGGWGVLLADLTSKGVILESSVNIDIPSSEIESAIESLSTSAGKFSIILILFSIWLSLISPCCFWICRTQFAFVQKPISHTWHWYGRVLQLVWDRRWCFRARKNLKSTPQDLQTVSGEWKFSMLAPLSIVYLLKPIDFSTSSLSLSKCFFLKYTYEKRGDQKVIVTNDKCFLLKYTYEKSDDKQVIVTNDKCFLLKYTYEKRDDKQVIVTNDMSD